MTDCNSIPVAPENSIKFSRTLEIESTGVEIHINQLFLSDEPSVVWDAALALGYYMDKLQMESCFFTDKTVVELGSGTGIVGLFAAALGGNVILTDVNKVLPLIQQNIDSNKHVLKGQATAVELNWGETELQVRPPDVILVSDCVYYEEGIDKIISTLTTLADRKTEIFIAYERRLFDNHIKIMDRFTKVLKELFSVFVVPRSEQHSLYNSNDILILRCKKL